MSLIEEVAAAVRAVIAEVEDQRGCLVQAIHTLSQARAAIQSTAGGTASLDVRACIAAQGAAIEAAERAVGQLGAVGEQIARYGAIIGVDLGGSTPAGSVGHDRPSQLSPVSTGLGDLVSAPEPPEAIHRVGRSLPERPGGRGPTHGWLLGADLQPTGDRPIRSGEDHTLIADLNLRGRETLARSLLADVESKAAAAIRRGHAPRDAVLVINNTPCVGRYGCNTLLPDILPAGSRLAVYVSDGDRTKLYKVYEGTGKKIR